jgi:hypothetical protein
VVKPNFRFFQSLSALGGNDFSDHSPSRVLRMDEGCQTSHNPSQDKQRQPYIAPHCGSPRAEEKTPSNMMAIGSVRCQGAKSNEAAISDWRMATKNESEHALSTGNLQPIVLQL